MALLSGCTANPERKKLEEIARRNPLDNAGKEAETVVIKKEQKKVQYPKVPTQDARVAAYVSGKSSKIYHVRGCEFIGKLASPVGFASFDDAERSGRMPCEFCKPRENSGPQAR